MDEVQHEPDHSMDEPKDRREECEAIATIRHRHINDECDETYSLHTAQCHAENVTDKTMQVAVRKFASYTFSLTNSIRNL